MAIFRSIASSLARRTMGVAILCAFIAAGIQALITMQDERVVFDRALRNVAETSVPLLSASLWDADDAAVRRHIRQIASQPEIAYARLTDRNGRVTEGGDARLRNPKPTNLLDIPHPQDGKGALGSLEITPGERALYQQVLLKVGAVVAGYAMLAAILCTLIVVIVRGELERPLRNLARFTSTLNATNLTAPLELERPRRYWRDEIDLVADGFRTLQDAIHAHVANLDAQVAVRTAQLQAALEEIKALTVTDALTGCFNRRHLDEKLVEEVLRSDRSGHSLSVIVTDIDHFKKVNDTYGHAAGDAVLRHLADIFKSAMRARVDWVARYGGEEFVIVLPDTDLGTAAVVAERLRAAIEAATFTHEGRELQITASFGVAQRAAGDDSSALVARADAALYRAKAAGRNRVLAADERTARA